MHAVGSNLSSPAQNSSNRPSIHTCIPGSLCDVLHTCKGVSPSAGVARATKRTAADGFRAQPGAYRGFPSPPCRRMIKAHYNLAALQILAAKAGVTAVRCGREVRDQGSVASREVIDC